MPQAFDNTNAVQSAINVAMGISADGDELLRRAPDSASMLAYWDLTDALIEGADAVIGAAEKYLPKFKDEEPDDYQNRLAVAKYTNIYGDTVEALASKPFEEEVTLVTSDEKNIPEQINKFIEDVDGSGNNLTVFASNTFFNGINSAIDWIFVDYPEIDPARVRSVADAKREGIRPFWSHVLGRNVLEAKVTMVSGKEQLSYIRIYEPGKPDHVRVIEKSEAGGVTWTLYQKQDKANAAGKVEFTVVGTGTYSIGVIPLVPFWTGRRDGRTFKFFPAMKSAADLQKVLYRQESGLEFIKTCAAYPMLAGNGIKPPMMADGVTPKKLRVGPSKVLYGAPNADGSHGEWGYVEPSAQSMEFLSKDVDKTKQDLRELGRQPLTAQSGNLTVITTAVAAGKAKSAVGAWALMLKNALENAMVLTGMWFNIQQTEYDPEVNVYTEFDDVLDDGKDVEALNSARERKDISQETYWIELKRRKVLAPEFDADVERDRLLKELPEEPDLEEPDDGGGQ